MSETNSTKPCKTCGRVRSLDGFHTNRLTKDGRQVNCKVCTSKYNAAYRTTNAEKINEYGQRWRQENAEKIKQDNRKRYLADPSLVIALNKAYREANPDRERANKARRRASKRKAPGDYTAQEIQQMYDDQQGLCAYCESELNGDYHVDHMIPLSREGANDWENLAIACERCNCRKYTKTAEEFMNARKK